MKVLFTSNSQAAALRRADRLFRPDNGYAPFFFVTPGATGPYLNILADGRLEPTHKTEKTQPYAHPPKTTEMRLSDFDAIVVSSLGFTDGGARFLSPFNIGPLVADFEPLETTTSDSLASIACFREVHSNTLLKHHGFRFARKVRDRFAGPILIQPTPYPSEILREDAEWPVNRKYRRAMDYYSFVQTLTNALLEKFAGEHSMTLLPRPPETLADGLFSRSGFIREDDAIHSNEHYGALVLAQVGRVLGAV